MKIKCPVCGVYGLVQQRGNSFRVQHYRGFVEGRRDYEYHKLEKETLEIMEVNGSKIMEVKAFKPVSNNENTSGRSLAWLGHRLPKPATRVQIPVTAP